MEEEQECIWSYIESMVAGKTIKQCEADLKQAYKDRFTLHWKYNFDRLLLRKSENNMTIYSHNRAPGSYQEFILHTGTALHETDATFEFLIADNRDLFAIKKSKTGTHSTEVHVLSASSNYQEFILHTGTALHETDATFEFLIADNRDLFAIKKSKTGTHSTEVHVLSQEE